MNVPEPAIPEQANRPVSGSQDMVQYDNDQDEGEEPILAGQDIEHSQSDGSESTRHCDYDLVEFNNDYFVMLKQFCQYLAKSVRRLPKLSLLFVKKFCRSMPNRSSKPTWRSFVAFLTLLL